VSLAILIINSLAMLIQFMFAFLYSIIFAVILTFIFKRRGPGPFHGIFYFFCIIFLFTVALSFLIHPVGPTFRKVPWFSLLAFAFLIMLLIAELRPHKDKEVMLKKNQVAKQKQVIKVEDLDEEEDEEVLETEFGIFFWIIIVCLVAAITYVLIASPY